MFNEGYLASSGDDVARARLAEDAEWLCGLLVSLMPQEPEPLGVLALMRLHRARLAARFTATGAIVLLREPDPGMTIEARAEFRRAAALTANRAERELLERASKADRSATHQYERGSPRTCSATKLRMRLVEIGATW